MDDVFAARPPQDWQKALVPLGAGGRGSQVARENSVSRKSGARKYIRLREGAITFSVLKKLPQRVCAAS